MYHTYTICSLAEERSRGRVLDPISMGCGFEPHLKHCVVFLNMTLNILCSVLVSPRWSRRDIVLASAVYAPVCLSVCLSVCLFTCPSRNIPKYLLVRFGAFSAWMDSTMDSPKCGSRGGQGVRTSPGKSQYIFYRNKQLEPPTAEKVGLPPPPGKCWNPSGTLKNVSFVWN